jgi:hypothetical protein
MNIENLQSPALCSVFHAIGAGFLTGLFFGIYPADRAGSPRPIDVLCYE